MLRRKPVTEQGGLRRRDTQFLTHPAVQVVDPSLRHFSILKISNSICIHYDTLKDDEVIVFVRRLDRTLDRTLGCSRLIDDFSHDGRGSCTVRATSRSTLGCSKYEWLMVPKTPSIPSWKFAVGNIQ